MKIIRSNDRLYPLGGRRRPIAHCPRMRLESYMRRDLPHPPAAVTYAPHAWSALAKIDENDTLGDCVIAGMEHLEGVFTGNAGLPPLAFSDVQTTALYSAIGGYKPGDPATDQGCDEQTALNYWQHHGLLGGHKISGWLAVKASDVVEVRTAAYLFENIFFGVELPDAWVNPMPAKSGFTWDIAGDANPDNGHCFVGVGYDAKGVIIDTWGMLGHITWAAVAKYASGNLAGELYTVLSQDIINKATQKAPTGFDWNYLLGDFKALGAAR
jgi:hypothetical protein